MSLDPAYVLTASDDDAGQRLDKWLATALAPTSRSRVRQFIENGLVTRLVDGARQTITEADHRVKPGETFEVEIPPPPQTDILPQDIPLDIVFEDEHLIVVNKPAGMVVHPAPGNREGTLVNALLAHCGPSLAAVGSVQRPGVVHRLDKDTSGIMVAAKTEAAYHGLVALFATHDIERLYKAVVWGVPQPMSGTVDAAVGRHSGDRKKMAITSRGKPAITHYKVEAVFNNMAALVACRLETGRTHQIRVHMTSIGHPIIGDATYGRVKAGLRQKLAAKGVDIGQIMGRQALHAAVLGFCHPITGKTLYFSKDPPFDILGLIDALETVKDIG